MRYLKLLCLLLLPLLVSCSKDYTNAIPARCYALAAVDAQQLQSTADTQALCQLLHTERLDACGLDLTSPLYAFYTTDGLFGMVAKVSSRSDCTDWLSAMGGKQKERRGHLFVTVADGQFLAGLSDDALLLMGPVVSASQATLMQRMSRCLDADDDADKPAELNDMLSQLDDGAAIRFVMQASALPSQVASLLTLCSDSLLSDVCLAATMQHDGDKLVVNGSICPLKGKRAENIVAARDRYRPVRGRYAPLITDSVQAAITVNTDGETLLGLLRSSESLNMLLAGINRAVDMDNIVRAINGETTIVLSSTGTAQPAFSMRAQIAHSRFLNDVGYWKTSCPQGTAITDAGPDAYLFHSPDADIMFGVDADNHEFYAAPLQLLNGESRELVPFLPSSEGMKGTLILRLDAIARQGGVGQSVVQLLSPLLCNATTIVYHIN